MNYNKFSRPNLIPDLQYNLRAKLDTGLKCNYNCFFCYYKNNLKDPELPLEEIKKRVQILKESGMKEVDLSGGESTIHSKWFEILEYCNENFERVSCLSNGSKLKSKNFTKKSLEKGLKEVLFSLHGYDEKSHDEIVGHKGAFKDIISAIRACQEIGIDVRINCTVTSKNMKNLKTYSNLIKDLNPSQLNYLPLNYWDDAKNSKPEKYGELSTYIKQSIDILENSNIEINVRYIPYCFMEGYERYVCNTYQHIFDLKDWNILIYDLKEPKKFTLEKAFNEAFNKRNYTYYKPKKCFECKFFKICDGVENDIKDIQDVYPIKGKKIENVMEFKCR